MHRKSQHSAAEKLAVLKELETGQAALSDVAQKYDISLTTYSLSSFKRFDPAGDFTGGGAEKWIVNSGGQIRWHWKMKGGAQVKLIPSATKLMPLATG